MDKLKKYNQWLLAIIGSLTVILAFMLIGIAGINLIDDILSYFDRDTVVNEVQANNTVLDGETEKRKQIIRFGNPSLIDSTLNLYLIPVGQKSLDEHEEILRPKKTSIGIVKRGYGYRYNSKSLNNLIIYNPKNNSNNILFDVKCSINTYSFEKIGNSLFLLMYCTKKDTNKDGLLNDKDLKSLFIYSFSLNKLIDVELGEHTSIKDYETILNSSHIIASLDIDDDKNGQIDAKDNSIRLKKIELLEDSIEVSELITNDRIEELQRLLDK